MVKRTIIFALVATSFTCFTLVAMADSTKSDDVARVQSAAEVFHEIMATPDKAVPQELLESAKCVAIIPGEKKFAFIVGGKYGKGLVTCRTAHGWSAPAFLTVGGGSYGLQIGGASTDIVMIFRNRNGLDSLLSDKFKIGGSATAAAGPVGRHVSANTDIKLKAQILTYARSRGAFAGISLNGAVVQPDDSGNAALYGPNARTKQIVDGKVRVPREAHALIAELDRYSREQAASNR
ncbi:MAG: lipid-binding SYLF domain-containing protein [Terriglobia bacterium]